MKKIMLSLGFMSVLAISLSAAKPVEAQPLPLSNRCCDANNYVRCVLVNGYFPVGSACFCEGQGYGWVC